MLALGQALRSRQADKITLKGKQHVDLAPGVDRDHVARLTGAPNRAICSAGETSDSKGRRP